MDAQGPTSNPTPGPASGDGSQAGNQTALHVAATRRARRRPSSAAPPEASIVEAGSGTGLICCALPIVMRSKPKSSRAVPAFVKVAFVCRSGRGPVGEGRAHVA